MPSVSKRVSIAWDGAAPFEDTETLVIVGNTYFVDVRVKKNTGDLDWAMAGVKEWVHQGSEPPKARFTPLLTSRPSIPGQSDMADEGTFSSLPNGDSLETGVMYDPEDGRKKPYQEIWHDLPASGAAFILESVDGTSDSETASQARKVWVALMGSYQVMVVRLSEGMHAAWTAARQSDGTWTILNHAGGDEMASLIPPMNVPDTPWNVGDTVNASESQWTVKEYFSVA